MNKKHSHRASLRTASITGALLLALAGAVDAVEPPRFDKPGPFKMAHWKVMNVLVETYGETDWSQVIDHLLEYPDDAGNPNVMVIPLSLGNVFLNRYEETGANSDYEKAFQHFESVAVKYKLWRKRRLTPEVVHYLAISVNRLRKHCDDHSDLPPVQRKPIIVLWREVKAILKAEAEYRLTADLPYFPYDSCFTGDSKGEENAREAALFAAAANFLPDDSQAAAWDEKARQLAYNSITRPSDPPDKLGIKTCTVEEDLSLSSHGFAPNPYSTAATLLLLSQGALTYRLAERAIPEEYMHNFEGLYRKYKSYLSSDLWWIAPADPEGDGALFPLRFDTRMEMKAVSRKAHDGYLWKPTKPMAVMGTGSDLWEAVQNSKVVLYYLVGSYLWHFPTKSPCLEVRFKMPKDEVRFRMPEEEVQ